MSNRSHLSYHSYKKILGSTKKKAKSFGFAHFILFNVKFKAGIELNADYNIERSKSLSAYTGYRCNTLFTNSSYFRRKQISFVKIVTKMEINASLL